jgi:hypothetical protein
MEKGRNWIFRAWRSNIYTTILEHGGATFIPPSLWKFWVSVLGEFDWSVMIHWPGNKLREKAWETVMQLVHYEDDNTRCICIGLVNKVLNMLAFWIEDPNSGALKLHVFGNMMKDKRDAIRLIADRWKPSVQSADWEPKRFVTIHVTPKSKQPARILGSKPGAPITTAHPYFDLLVDMDPRLVVAMLDLPRDAAVNAVVLRFGGECELVWLHDKNAVAVFNDPARAATALRRLDYGSAYQGAAMFMPNSSTQPGNVWVGA